MRTLFLLVWIQFLMCATGYRFLALPVQMRSHMAEMRAVAEQLVQEGHEVNMVHLSGFPQPEDPLPPDLRILRFHCKEEQRCGWTAIQEFQRNVTRWTLEGRSLQEIFQATHDTIGFFCNELLTADENFFTDSGGTPYDMAIVDGLFLFRCMYLVPHRLGIPWVTLTTAPIPEAARLPHIPSFVPSVFTGFTERMTFWERVQNTLVSIMFAALPQDPPIPPEVLQDFHKYGNYGSLANLESQSLLWLYTTDVTMDYAKPLAPNVIPVGGLTTGPVTGNLTYEFVSFLNSGHDGCIVVTFGSAVDELPRHIVEAFFAVFESFPQFSFAWKIRHQNYLKIPPNVRLFSWLPQNALLADSRVVTFITHCGANSQYEALYNAVPMICFPMNGDQWYNAARMKAKGYGEFLDIKVFKAHNLRNAILEITSNQKYRKAILKGSQIFKDRPQRPAEVASFWIQHVAKYGGEHLRSEAFNLTLAEYYMLDILCFALLCVCVIFIVTLVLLTVTARILKLFYTYTKCFIMRVIKWAT